VAGHGVEGLVLPAIPVRAARIEQQRLWLTDARGDLGGAGRDVRADAGMKTRGLDRRRLGRHRPSRIDPGVPAAVEDRGGIMSEPAHHPPHARRVIAAARIVGHDLRPIPDAHFAEAPRKPIGLGKRMTAIAARHGGGQVRVEVDEARAGDVRHAIGTAAGFDIGEIVAAITHGPAGVIEMCREIGYGNKGSVGHPDFEG